MTAKLLLFSSRRYCDPSCLLVGWFVNIRPRAWVRAVGIVGVLGQCTSRQPSARGDD